MIQLATSSGEVFSTGAATLRAWPAIDGERLSRVRLQVAIAGIVANAVIDTGGAYLVVDPQLARKSRLHPPVHEDRIVIRGFVYRGMVHRVPVTLIADAGESLQFEATAFVPELDEGEHWPLPSYLGWQGCLERIRLALDPGTERVYFGALR
jgi:predicted aspartyl protease